MNPRLAPAVLLLLAACGGGGGELPPFPAAADARFPASAEGARFVLRAARAPVGDEGEWLYVVGRDGWAWLGTGAEDGAWNTLQANSAAPAPQGAALLPLPAGDWACAGELSAYLELRFPGASNTLRGLPALWGAAAGQLLAADDALAREDTALVLALVDAAAGLGPRLLGRVEAVAQGLDGEPCADLRLQLQPPLATPHWQEAWKPPALPEGVGLLRVELARDGFWPLWRGRLEALGLDPRAEPQGDFAFELHLLSLDGNLGVVLLCPEEWAPGALPDPSALVGDLQGFPLIGDWSTAREVRGGTAIFSWGGTAFRAALEQALERDRPQPFAERRWQWPRGGVGLILDLRALQDSLRRMAPVPVPSLQSASAGERLVEAVATAEDGALRLRARWPVALSGGPAIGDMQMDSWMSQRLLDQALRWLLMPEED